MQFSAIAAIVLSGSFAAAFNACPTGGLFTSTVCCDTEVAGVLGVGCEIVDERPNSPRHFKRICGAKIPRCCVLPVAGQGVLCQKPVGV